MGFTANKTYTIVLIATMKSISIEAFPTTFKRIFDSGTKLYYIKNDDNYDITFDEKTFEHHFADIKKIRKLKLKQCSK